MEKLTHIFGCWLVKIILLPGLDVRLSTLLKFIINIVLYENSISFGVFGFLWGGVLLLLWILYEKGTYIHAQFCSSSCEVHSPSEAIHGSQIPPDGLIWPYPELSIQHQGGPWCWKKHKPTQPEEESRFQLLLSSVRHVQSWVSGRWFTGWYIWISFSSFWCEGSDTTLFTGHENTVCRFYYLDIIAGDIVGVPIQTQFFKFF